MESEDAPPQIHRGPSAGQCNWEATFGMALAFAICI